MDRWETSRGIPISIIAERLSIAANKRRGHAKKLCVARTCPGDSPPKMKLIPGINGGASQRGGEDFPAVAYPIEGEANRALSCPSECTPIAMKLRPAQRAPRAHRPVMMQRVYVKSTPVASEQKQAPLTAHRLARTYGACVAASVDAATRASTHTPPQLILPSRTCPVFVCAVRICLRARIVSIQPSNRWILEKPETKLRSIRFDRSLHISHELGCSQSAAYRSRI